MGGNSTQVGPLTPELPSPPLEDNALDAFIQTWLVGVTGLPGQYVRPKWQTTTPKQPDQSTTWCAFGIIDDDSDAFPAIEHDGSANGGLGQDDFYRHAELTVFVSFYGPQAKSTASQTRDGVYVDQNREYLYAQDMALVECRKISAVPEVVNTIWVRRYDLPIRLRRQIQRSYDVRNIVSATASTTSN